MPIPTSRRLRSPSEPTALETPFELDLDRAAAGDRDAVNRLWSDHYEDLRALVLGWFLRQRSKRAARGQVSIGPTHIVGALFERLHDRSAVFGRGRAFLFSCFYQECARIFVDHLRRTCRHHDRRVEFESQLLPREHLDAKLDVIAGALETLGRSSKLEADIAAMKIFESIEDDANPGAMRGLYNHEIAERLGCSLRQVEKHWKFAKSYLFAKLGCD